MPTFERSIVIRGDRAALFDLTQDYDRRLAWDPFLKEARLVGGAPAAGVGVRAWCVATNGLGMETEYVTFRRPDVVAVKMTRGPVLFASFAGSWRFHEVAPGLTRVTFRYNLKARLRWLRPIVDPIARAILERDIEQRLMALKRVVESTSILTAVQTSTRPGRHAQLLASE